MYFSVQHKTLHSQESKTTTKIYIVAILRATSTKHLELILGHHISCDVNIYVKAYLKSRTYTDGEASFKKETLAGQS